MGSGNKNALSLDASVLEFQSLWLKQRNVRAIRSLDYESDLAQSRTGRKRCAPGQSIERAAVRVHVAARSGSGRCFGVA